MTALSAARQAIELTPEAMTKDERSCLLYLESCAVDAGGLCEGVRMNGADFAAIEKFEDAGLASVHRISSSILGTGVNKSWTHWAQLTEAGFALAAQCRKLRSLQYGTHAKAVVAELRKMGKINS